MMLSYDKVIQEKTADDEFNRTPMIGEAISNEESIDYPDYQDYQKSSSETSSNSMTSNWNISNYNFHEYGNTNVTVDSVKNKSKVETTVNARERNFIFDRNLSPNLINVADKNVDLVTSTNQSDATHKTDVTYMDEWQATAEKITSNNVPSSNSNVKIELQQTESHSKNMPLLHGI